MNPAGTSCKAFVSICILLVEQLFQKSMLHSFIRGTQETIAWEFAATVWAWTLILNVHSYSNCCVFSQINRNYHLHILIVCILTFLVHESSWPRHGTDVHEAHLCLQNLHLNVQVLGGCQGECLLSFLSYSAPVKEPVQNTIFCFSSENEEMSCHILIPENGAHLPNHSMNKEFTVMLVLSIYH